MRGAVDVNSGNKPNNYLRHHRSTRCWSLQRVADEIRKMSIKENGKEPGVNADMVGQWERGIKTPSPYYREKLCQIYGTQADQLGFQISPVVLSAQNLTENNIMNSKRRELLYLLSLAGTALTLPFPDLDWDRISKVQVKPSLLDDVVLDDLETMNTHYWRAYLASSPKKLVLDGVLRQLKMLVGFLKEPHVAFLHTRLCSIASDLSQLTGEIFLDVNDYDAAQSCYVFSAFAAKEALAYDLWACAFIRHSFLPIFDEQYQDALPLLYQARKLAQHGNHSLTTRFWTEAVSADAYAGIGDLTSCQRALDTTKSVFLMSESANNGSWLRFDSGRIAEQTGACYVRLGQPDLAESALQEALVHLPLANRRKAIVLTDLAKVALQKHNVEQACSFANQAIEIAVHKPSGVISKGIFSLSTQLESYASSAVVKDFRQRVGLLL